MTTKGTITDARARGRARLRAPLHIVVGWAAVWLGVACAPSHAHDAAHDEPLAESATDSETGVGPEANGSAAMCPVTVDEPIDPEIHTDHDGERVHFCCRRCRRQFLEDPARYLPNLTQPASAGGDTARASTGAHAHVDAHDHEHDHDHGEEPRSILLRAVRYAGKLHPIAVHFPIGLLIGALVTETLTLFGFGAHFRLATRGLLLMGVPAALVAAAFGWAAGWSASYPGDMARVLTLHRWLGTATAAASVMALVASERMHRTGGGRRVYLPLLLFLALIVGVTGHFGGTLIFGSDHLNW